MIEANRHLVGKPGSRFELDTPALVLDLDALECNIALMMEIAGGFSRNLRPHAKSHKCSTIARMQVAAGAIGVCCATLDEAEVMAFAGVTGLVITSPITTQGKLRRLTDLVRHAPDTMLVVDHPENVAALGAAAGAAGVTLRLLVDVELGFGRTGVLTVDDAENLARCIEADPALIYAGLQAYGGHLQHTADYKVRLDITRKAGDFVAEIIGRLTQIGRAPPIVTGGGTGTHAIDGRFGPFTENQAGSYIFMDADYRAVTFEEGRDWPFATSLFVQMAVISANVAGTVTIDGGTKAFALNGPKPVVVSPELAGALYEFSGDEHGRLRLAAGQRSPALGQRVECMVSHCDPTVALYDVYHCVRGDTLVDIWPIDARGRR